MKNKKSYLLFITAVAALGGLLFGYDTAVISGTVKYLGINFIDPRGLGEAAANSLLGFAVSSALIGCVIGSFSGGYLAARFGRKKGLMTAAILLVVSAIGSAFPDIMSGSTPTYHYLPHFIFYRIIGGMGIGLASMLSPMYIAEMAPPDKRGSLVSLNQFAIVTGILVVYFVNYGIALKGSEEWIARIGWRLMFLSEVIPASALLAAVFFIPESPRWLVMKGHDGAAADIISRVSGREAVVPEIKSIKESLGSVVKTKLFTYGVGVIVIGILLSMFQQFVGINVVMYYAPEIFRNMGMETDSAFLQTIIVGTINVLFTIIAIFTVDKLGRKPLMITGSVVMSVSMLALGCLFFRQNMGVAALISMLCYVAAFSMSWGPVCWVLLSEIFPNLIRSQALAIAVSAQWVANYLVSWTFPMMDRSTILNDLFHGGFAYWIYGLMAVVSALFIWRFVPETKGKTLEEMNALFARKRA